MATEFVKLDLTGVEVNTQRVNNFVKIDGDVVTVQFEITKQSLKWLQDNDRIEFTPEMDGFAWKRRKA
jgi:hypothetical protein